MSRIKPWRAKSTFIFDELLELSKNTTFYLVHEPGPTNLIIQDERKMKFQVKIGTTISWTWGGGKKEHWVHTIFALFRIFKLPENEPLIWQLSFSDAEIGKIIQNRDRSVFRRMTQENRDRKSFLKSKRNPKEERKTVKRSALDSEEPCCIWFDEMKNDQNLTFCKYGWGQNMHMNCAQHLVKHKTSEK